MKIHLLSGFLGSGKTTAIQQACRFLQQSGSRPAVITNDQGIKLVDGRLFKSLGIPSLQVVNGCFCCNYGDLDNCINSLQQTDAPDVLFAESVGSCTDIVATVVNPLLRYRRDLEPSLSAFADARLLRMMLVGNAASFDKSVRYIYFKQLEEARIIVVSKTDLLAAGQLDELKVMMRKHYAEKTVLFQNSFKEEHIGTWLSTIGEAPLAGLMSAPEVDYAVYGEGEAMLAWLDKELGIVAAREHGEEAARALAEGIYEQLTVLGYPIGHLKFLLNESVKISYTTGGNLQRSGVLKGDTGGGEEGVSTLLINARVQTEPEILAALVQGVIKKTERGFGCKIIEISERSFRPGYPEPMHRILG